MQAVEQSAVGIGELQQRLLEFAQQLHVVLHVAQRGVQLVGDAGDHLAQRGHLLRLHQLGLGFLEVDQRPAQHGVALGDALFHGLEQVEHRA
ncbi:hypothetical protein D3C81_1628410 [compost metagenome]